LFKSSYTEQGSIVIVTFVGDIILSNSEEIKGVFRQCLENGPEIVGIDCKGAHTMDSSGLGMFIGFSKDAARKNARIVIMDLPEGISRLFNMSKLDTYFDLMTRQDFQKTFVK